jgi:hypothetical protein
MKSKMGKREVHVTKGGLETPVEGFGSSDFPKSSAFFKMYGKHKEPGADAPPMKRPEGSSEGQIVAKFKKGR